MVSKHHFGHHFLLYLIQYTCLFFDTNIETQQKKVNLKPKDAHNPMSL
jgi:hypothetical protein